VYDPLQCIAQSLIVSFSSQTQYLEIVNGMFVEGLEMMSGQMTEDHIDTNIKNRDGPVIFSEISVSIPSTYVISFLITAVGHRKT